MNDLGKIIRIMRQAKSLSLGDFAESSGVSAPFASLVEKGARQPSLDVLRRFAATLKIPSEVLVLLACGRNAELKSTDSASRKLIETVGKLVDMESKLSQLLDPNNDKSKADSDQAERFGSGDGCNG